MTNRMKAFTLVELLVVIGIIALLISILLPSLTKARRQAQAVVDLSNIRQVALALLNYTADNRRILPGDGPNKKDDASWMWDPSWAQLTQQYKIPKSAYGCNTLENIRPQWSSFGLYTANWRGSGYSIIGWNYFGGRNPNGGGAGSDRAFFDTTTKTWKPFIVARSFYDKSATSQVLLTCLNYDAVTPGKSWESIAPHYKGNALFIPAGGKWLKFDGMNVAWLDGHASWVSYSQMTQVQSPYGGYVYIPDPYGSAR
jgi:prepilin-type N-terminal cleavage/methylation domain-containing protein/prepilin-type processing-associated H-X9-DG protein